MSTEPFPDGLPLDPAAYADLVARILTSSMGNVVEQMMELGKRLGDDEGSEFAAGLRSILHDSIDRVIRADADDSDLAAALTALATFLDSWMVSSQLDGSIEWHRQMDESADALRRGDLGQPVSAADL